MNVNEHTVNGVTFLSCDGFSAAGGVVHGFSTRLGGVSEGLWSSMNLGTTRGDHPDHVRENYRRFCAAIGADVHRIAMSNQVHSDVVRTITSADVKSDLYDPEGYEADGLVTDIPGTALVIFSADCLPILFYDPVRRVAAAVHAGWRGTALGITGRTVDKMAERYGCRPQDILCAIGPGLSGCCFETHEDVPNAMTAALGRDALPCIETLPTGKYKLDLKALNTLWMTRAGILPEHIAVSPACTACAPDKYWSHRGTGERRGSQAAVIQLTANP